MILKNFKYIIPSFILLLSTFSCTDDKCNLETDTLLKTEFLVVDNTLVTEHFLDSLSIYSPLWPDSIHYKEEGKSNIIYFMLSPESDTSTIIITSKVNPNNDTLNFYYTREMVLLSPECGFVVNYNIDSINNTFNNIDSIKISTSTITTDENGYVKIYF